MTVCHPRRKTRWRGVRRLCMALPEVIEGLTHGGETWFIRRRSFAKFDGILPSHQVLADGSRRDTVVYSILDIEWPAARKNLRYRLDRNA